MVKLIEELSELPVKGAVVIDFFATWCGPCKAIAPLYEKLAGIFTEIVCVKVDVDESQAFVDKYEIRAMPTFLFLKDGEVVKRVEGADVREIQEGFEALGK
jgi:thioredoxin 1